MVLGGCDTILGQEGRTPTRRPFLVAGHFGKEPRPWPEPSTTYCEASPRRSAALNSACPSVWIRTQPQGTSFYQRQISEAIGTDARYIRREIHILAELGMINPQPAPNQREVRRFYQADHTHQLWGIIDATITACDRLSTSA